MVATIAEISHLPDLHLLDNGHHSTIGREESIRLWERTYEGQENAVELVELCRDCVEAIVDAGFSGR